MENPMRVSEMVRICLMVEFLVAAMLPANVAAQAKQHEAKAAATAEDHQHDFDFEFGSWKAHLRRLVHPLSGSNEWVEYDGPSVVRKVWNGAANLGEIKLSGKSGHIEGMSLRLYNPESQKWSIYWANRSDGSLGVPPMVGDFHDGRGEFEDQETFNGKPVRVRFIFSDITATSFRLEQAFSPDDGKTWEPNWKVTFTKVGR